MKALGHLNKYLFKYKVSLLLGFVSILFSNFFGLFPAIFIGKSFDFIETRFTNDKFLFENNWLLFFENILFSFFFLIILFVLLKGIFMFFTRQTVIVVSRKIEYDLKNEIYSKYQELNMSFFNKHNLGDIISRISEDVSKVRMYLGPAILYSMNLVILLVFILTRMIIVSPSLTFWALLPLPILSISIYYISKSINKKSEYTQVQLANLTNASQQIISGMKTIKSSVREVYALKYFNDASKKYMKSQLDLVNINALFFPFMLLIVGSSILLTIWAGSYYNVKIGTIAEFIIYVNMLTWPVTSIGWVTSIIQTAAASQKRINNFLFQKSEPKGIINENLINANIKFENVFYNYLETDKTVLKNINIVIQNGKSLGIVGSVGSGKSTIIKLICNFYSPSKGNIYIDDKPIKNLDIKFLRKSISYVPQDDFLFSDTIRNNILFGNSNATQDDIITVLKDVFMYNEVCSFKNGLDTYIGERGVTLSGGQKQRLSIARAILKKSKILLLDDCLSSVDINTEREILYNIYTKYKKDITTIIVSNRIHSIMHCDNIIVLEKGEIIESGNHTDLIKLNGFYHKLNSIQAQNIN